MTGGEARPGRRTTLLIAVLVLLLIAGAVTVAVLWRDRADLRDRAAAERAATAEAERIVVAWLSYDYRTYLDDMKWVTDSGTDDFEKEYSTEAFESLRRRMVGPRRLISEGRVVESAATAEDADTVKVVVFTDQTLTDKDMRQREEAPLHARSGVELRMVRQGDDWLVDELTQLQFQ